MKYKSYKDSNVEMTTGLNAELLDKNDIISARSINRPIVNILENQETDYNLLQTLLKTVYGDRNGIIPDIQEEFIPEAFQIGSFSNDTSNYFVRLPLGSMFLSKDPKDKFNINDENPFSAQGEYNYKDAYGKDSFLKDKLHSYIIENKPEINLYERQLASFIGLDLTYLDNDIKIYEDLIPFAVKVAVIDEDTHKIKNGSDGSPMYMQDENSNTIYLAKEGEGDLDIFVGNEIQNPENYNFETVYDKTINSVTPSLTNDVVLQYIDYNENLTTKKTPNGRYTSDISKAVTLKDSNGETKYHSGYYVGVIRSTDADNEETWLPNLAENSNFEIYMPSISVNKATVSVVIKNGENIVESFIYNLEGDNDIKTSNENFYAAAYEKSNNFIVKKIQSKLPNEDIVIGTKLISKTSNEIANNYTISISYLSNEITTPVVDVITERQISDIKINTKTNQKYYDNIFDLTNSFFGKFSSLLASISNLYNYTNLETIIKLPLSIINNFYVYYDLEGNIDNQIKENYDKTGRFFISNSESENPKHIKLFRVIFSKSDVAPYTNKITKVISYMSNLDRRTITTKRAELSTLLVNSRTDLRNYFLLRDNDGNRTIELTENFDNPDNEQTRYASPITRITDKIETDKLENQDSNTWNDYANGDTPSDFFEEAYPVRNFITDEKYFNQHNDYSNKGIIIDRNKGLKIFNNSGLINYPFSFGDIDKEDYAKTYNIYKKYLSNINNLTVNNFKDKIDEFKSSALSYSSYSEFQPLEIISKYGNINIVTSDYNKSRINIRNIQDSDNNIIDLFGITRIRSSRKYQLVVRKISDREIADASIAFVTGPSASKEDQDAFNTEKNIFAGYLGFNTGANKIINNRTFNLYITSPGKKEEGEQKLALSVRNTYPEGNYFTATLNGDFVGSSNNNLLGYPVRSRTYIDYEETNKPYIEYTKDLVSLGVNINGEGTIDRIKDSETRWLAAFVRYGYFGRLTLADTNQDIINNDTRDGALRLGNSNIFDVSSIYINKHCGLLNFDNEINNKTGGLTENTIRSIYGIPENEENEGTSSDGFSFILKRRLGQKITSPTYTEEKADNFCALHISPKGTYVNKNLEVTRQLFVNNHKNSSNSDNSALVVKGQTVSQGEIIINKNYDKVVNDTNYNSITRNTDDKNKYYDFEFFSGNVNDGPLYEDRAYNEEQKKYSAVNRETNLFTFVNFGKTYFEGNIKTGKNSIFESDSTFNKSLTINNNRVANFKYNTFTRTIPTGEADYFPESSIDPNDNYYNNNLDLPRNNVSFNVVSGKVIFGSDYSTTTNAKKIKDASDVIINGTGFIRRRLEISEENSILINTRKVYNSLLDTYTKKKNSKYVASEFEDSHNSPFLFVRGSAHITGDVVFGRDPRTNEDYYYLPNTKKINGVVDESSPSKVIFWGKNDPTVTLDSGVKDWRTDFDFHGKTWFDNIVKIGSKTTELNYADSNEPGTEETGSLTIYGKDNPDYSLEVEGSAKFSQGKEFDINSEDVLIKAQKEEDYASIHMNGEEQNFEVEAESGLKTLTIDPDKILIEDKTAESIKLVSKMDNHGSDFELKDTVATLNADDNVDINTSETTIVSGNNVINAKDDTFISQITNKKGNDTFVVNEISQTKENEVETIKLFSKNKTKSERSGTVKVETFDYIVDAYDLDSDNKNIVYGEIKETTKNKTVKVAANYEEAETNYHNLASNKWEAEIKNNETDTVKKSIKGDGTSWKLTHGTTELEANSNKSTLKMNTSDVVIEANKADKSIAVSTNNKVDNDILLNSSAASVKHKTKVYLSGSGTELELTNQTAKLQTTTSALGNTAKVLLKSGGDDSGATSTINLSTTLGNVLIGDKNNSAWKENGNLLLSAAKNGTSNVYIANLAMNNNSSKLNNDTAYVEIYKSANIHKVTLYDGTSNQLILTDNTTINSVSDFDLTCNNNKGKLLIDGSDSKKSFELSLNNIGLFHDGLSTTKVLSLKYNDANQLMFENNASEIQDATLTASKKVSLFSGSTVLDLNNKVKSVGFNLSDGSNTISSDKTNSALIKLSIESASNGSLKFESKNVTLTANNLATNYVQIGNTDANITIGKPAAASVTNGSANSILAQSNKLYLGTEKVIVGKKDTTLLSDMGSCTLTGNTLRTDSVNNSVYCSSTFKFGNINAANSITDIITYNADNKTFSFASGVTITFGEGHVKIQNGVLYVDNYAVSIS